MHPINSGWITLGRQRQETGDRGMKNVNERIAALSSDQQMMLLQRLRQKAAQPASSALPAHSSLNEWIVRYRPNEQARMRLFCFPYAGGRASIFRSWLDALPEEVELCGIQLPGREDRLGEQAYTRLTPLVQTLAEAIYPYLDKPFAFYGHSMGSLISFELARELRRIICQASGLFISCSVSCPSPS